MASLDVPGAPHPSPVVLRDAAVSTAGDAEQWLTADGVRYSHILDPRTGWPMTIRSSTTVIARRGLDADRLDTAIAVLGPDKGLPLAEETPGAAVLSVRQERDGHITIHQSSRWPGAIRAAAVRPLIVSSRQKSTSSKRKRKVMFMRIDARQILGVFGGAVAAASLFVSGESSPSAQTAPAITATSAALAAPVPRSPAPPPTTP